MTASSLSFAGPTNIVNIDSVSGISGYPTPFPIIKYSGALSGTLNLGIGTVPSPITSGFFSNDVPDSIIYLVLTNGPSTLTWTGTDPTFPTNWDLVSINWIAFKGSPTQAPSAFNTDDPVIFDDTGSTTLINITTNLQPGFIAVTNSALNYTFTGAGSLNGVAKLVKYGTGSLTLLDSGVDTYSKGVAVNQGTLIFASSNGISGGTTIASGATVQVGQNTGAGNLPSGNINNSGIVSFDIGAIATNTSAFVGAGTITKIDGSTLNLSGNSSAFNGPITAYNPAL